MEAKLIVIRGKANKNEVALKLPSVIGRSREADLTIGHPMVSRRHCELFETDGTLMIRDLGSLNGTLINGEKVSEAEIPADAEVTVGPLTFKVVIEQPAPAGEVDFGAIDDFAFEPAGDSQAEADETPIADTADLTDLIDMPPEPTPAPAKADADDDAASFFMDDVAESQEAAAPASPGEVTIDDEPEPTPPPLPVQDEAIETPPAKPQPPETEEFVFEETEAAASEPAPAKAASAAGEAAAASGNEEFIFEQDIPDDEPAVELTATVATPAIPVPDTPEEEEAFEPAPAVAKEDPKKAKKGGWWPFGGKDKGGKDTKTKKEPAKAAVEPAAKKAAPAETPTPAPAPAAAPAKKAEAALDDMVFDALQDDEPTQSGGGGDDGLDDFLKGLK